MAGFETMLPELRGLLAALVEARAATWLRQPAEADNFIDRKIAGLRARIAHLERLPQREGRTEEPSATHPDAGAT